MRFLFLMLLLAGLPVAAQTGSITGKVSFEGDEPALGVNVIISGTQKNGVTDIDGHFTIKSLPYGTYTLEFSSIEAKAKSTTVTLNASTATVNTILERSSALLDEVKLNKISEKRAILDKGFAVNIIETQQAAQRNLQTNDLLDRTVGVRIRQNGGLGSDVNYNLNGMSGNSVKIFVDGIPISTYGSSFSLNSIPPALIERIEVYKGVLPAHLADDALGGAINVILKKGTRNMLNASVSYGSFNTVQSQVNGMYRGEKGFTVKASAFQNYSDNDYKIWGKFVFNRLGDGTEQPVKVRRFNDMYRSVGGRVEAGYTDVKWADNFLIGYNGSSDYRQIQHGQYMTTPYKGRFTKGDTHVFSLNYVKANVLKGLDVNVNAVYSQRNDVVNDTVKWIYNWHGEIVTGLYGEKLQHPNGGAQQGMPTINHIMRDILSSRATASYNITDNHRLVFSHMFNRVDRNERDDMRSELERSFIEVRDLQKNVSSLAYELRAFDSSLQFTLFGKHYEQKVTERTPRLEAGNRVIDVTGNVKKSDGYGAASSYYIIPKVMLLASAERAVRMPNENEIFGSPGDNILGQSTLRPEISDNLNAGLRIGAFKIDEHRFTVSGTAFWRNTKDKIVRQINDRVNDAIQATPNVNLGKTQSHGFEATFEYIYDNRLFVNMNLSKFNIVDKNRDAQGRPLLHYDKQLPNEPFFTVNGNVQYNFKDIIQQNAELSLFYNFGYVDPFHTNWLMLERFRTPPQFINDAGLSYTFPKKDFIVSFDARNMFNRQAYDNFAVQKPGRAFYLKINYTINKF